MPRIRTVKPDFWLDRKLAEGLTRDQRLFYIGLWNHADDEGRFVANARMLLGLIFPFDMDLNETDVDGFLCALEDLGRVVLYTDKEERYGWIPRFLDHQKINNPSRSRIPAPSNNLDLFTVALPEGSPSPVVLEKEKEEEKEKEREKEMVQKIWTVFLDELGGPSPKPKLTTERKKKLKALYREQLAREKDPLESFRRVLLTVKSSDFHMATRKYQMPESLFRNAERRDNWMTESKSSGTHSFAEDELRRITGE